MFSSGDMGEEKITFLRCLDPEKGKRKKDAEGNLLKVEVFNLEKKSKRLADKITLITADLLKRDNCHPG